MSNIGILIMGILTAQSSPPAISKPPARLSSTVQSEPKHLNDVSRSEVAPPELTSFEDSSSSIIPELTTKDKNDTSDKQDDIAQTLKKEVKINTKNPVYPSLVTKSKGSKESKQIFVFGDSLSDNGNLYELSEGKVPSSQQNFQGRASNGQVWTEHLNKLGIDTKNIHNFAIGGATTGSQNFLSQYPGMNFQVNKFTSGEVRVHPDDLIILWIGTNDYMIKPTTDSKQVVDNVSKTIATFIDKGARNIAVANLTDLGKIPWNSNSEAASSFTTATDNHNRQLNAALNMIAANNPNVKIIPLDFNSLFKEITAEPEKYGFTNVTDSYIDSNVQKAGSNPDEYLFWDVIHPSKRTHQLMAEYAIAAINAYKAVVPQGDIGLNIATRQNQSIDSRLQTLRQKPINSSNRWGVFVSGDINFGEKNSSGDFSGFNSNAAGVSVGYDYHFTDKLAAGVAVSLTGNENKLHQNQGTINTKGYAVSAYGNYSNNNFYVSGAASLGDYEFDIKRNITFNNRIATANTDSKLFSVNINSGYDAKLGNLTFSPMIGFKYDHLNLNGYTEKGAGSLNIKVYDQQASSPMLILGASATTNFKSSIGTIAPYIRGSYEYQLSNNSRTITAEFISQPGIPIRTVIPETDRDYFKVNAGAELLFSQNLFAALSYETMFGLNDVSSNTIRGEINYRF